MTGRFIHSTIAQLKMTFRNRVALFWSLMFPIIFMTLLGLLFCRSIDAGTITVVDKAHVAKSAAVVHALRRDGGDVCERDRPLYARRLS